MEQITLRRDVVTPVGILAAGVTLPAERATETEGWLVQVSLPRGSEHTELIRPSAVDGGYLQINAVDAAHDYRTAREFGMDDPSAVMWLVHGYNTTERQLYRWGLADWREEFR